MTDDDDTSSLRGTRRERNAEKHERVPSRMHAESLVLVTLPSEKAYRSDLADEIAITGGPTICVGRARSDGDDIYDNY